MSDELKSGLVALSQDIGSSGFSFVSGYKPHSYSVVLTLSCNIFHLDRTGFSAARILTHSDSEHSASQADHFWRMRTRFGRGCTAEIGHPPPTNFGVTLRPL